MRIRFPVLLLATLLLAHLAACGPAEEGKEGPARGAPVAVAPPPAATAASDAVPGWREAGAEGPQATEEQAARIRELLPELASRGPARREARDEIIAMGPAAVPALITHMESPEMAVRWEMVNILGYIGDVRGIDPLLERTLSDENPHPRWRAIWAVGAVDNGRAAGRVWERLQSGELGEAQRWNAAVVLSNLGEERVLPILREGLEHPTSWRRWEAVNALGRIHGEGDVERLGALLDDPDQSVRRETVMTLGRIGDAEAVDVLVEALENPDPEIRWRAAMSLERTGDEGALQAIEARLEVETHEMTRKHLERARTRLSASTAP
jgi:HEAT repeat protein